MPTLDRQVHKELRWVILRYRIVFSTQINIIISYNLELLKDMCKIAITTVIPNISSVFNCSFVI